MQNHGYAAALFCLFVAAGAAPASAEQWIATWGAAPAPPVVPFVGPDCKLCSNPLWEVTRKNM